MNTLHHLGILSYGSQVDVPCVNGMLYISRLEAVFSYSTRQMISTERTRVVAF